LARGFSGHWVVPGITFKRSVILHKNLISINSINAR